MLRPLRDSRWFVPRFGMMWMAVGMLLLISAAGWWKFHRDLYVEERDAVRRLNEAEGKVTVHRSASSPTWTAVNEEPDAIPWNAPLLPPIDRISVESDVPREARDVALALPRLTSYGRLNWNPGVSPVVFDFEAYLGRPLPELPPATLAYDAVDTPFPEGEPVAAAEADRVASAIREAWSRDSTPSRFLLVSRGSQDSGKPFMFSPGARALVVEPDRRFHFDFDEQRLNPDRAIVLRDGISYQILKVGPTWRKVSRRTDNTVIEFDEAMRRYPHDDFPYLAVDFNAFRLVSEAIAAMPELKLKRVARIDDVRYRVDFQPFVVPLRAGEGWDHYYTADPRVEEWTCVLRSDLGWAPEESRIVQALRYAPATTPTKYVRRVVQRYVVEGGSPLMTERHSLEGAETPAGFAESGRAHCLYARESEPVYAERIFDPLSLDAEPWPAPRELPWLRWYRVTLVLTCVLGLYLVGRRWRQPKSRPGSLEGPTDPSPDDGAVGPSAAADSG